MSINDFQDECLNHWDTDVDISERVERNFLLISQSAGEVSKIRNDYLLGEYATDNEYLTDMQDKLGDLMFAIAVTSWDHDLSLSHITGTEILKLRNQ